jgi:hypothetical protein
VKLRAQDAVGEYVRLTPAQNIGIDAEVGIKPLPGIFSGGFGFFCPVRKAAAVVGNDGVAEIGLCLEIIMNSCVLYIQLRSDIAVAESVVPTLLDKGFGQLQNGLAFCPLAAFSRLLPFPSTVISVLSGAELLPERLPAVWQF